MGLSRVALIAIGVLMALPVSAQSTRSTGDPLVITRNPYIGTPVSPYDRRVSPYSRDGANNPYTTGGGKIYGADGKYLGRLNANPYDPESVSNPYGKYGSPYSQTSITNPYSSYGSPYSNASANNPYATKPPVVLYRSQTQTPRRARPDPYDPYQPRDR
jgi:hypothetical protein